MPLYEALTIDAYCWLAFAKQVAKRPRRDE